jgi:hypothetical protein
MAEDGMHASEQWKHPTTVFDLLSNQESYDRL